MNFKKIFLLESIKLSAFLTSLLVFIYLTQSYYEKQGNQYFLVDKKSGTCPLYPDKLLGNYDVSIQTVPTKIELESSIENLKPGGIYRPSTCKEREKLAIIIPYRDREDNLLLLIWQ